ncbi:MAG: STAS domain-containing protein [Planctomycetota bacterium]|jgi:anti-anti-sigma factor
MRITITENAGITVLRLIGNLDTNSTPELEAHLSRLTEAGTRRLLIDLGEVDFVSSAGLGALLSAAQALAPCDGTLSVCGPNEAVRHAFDASGFSRIFKVFENEQDALSSI